MLRLPPFEYLAPQTLEEAVNMMGSDEAMLVAGGTDVYPGMKRRIFEPKKLIGLRKIEELKKFEVTDKGITLGAGLTLSEIIENPIINEKYPALVTAAGLVSTPQLRNTGTIGGNLCVDTRCTYYNQTEPWRKALNYCIKKDGDICWVAIGSSRCWAVSSSDTAPVMVALGAFLRLVGPDGERTLPIQKFYNNDGIQYINKHSDEILVDIHIPDSNGVKMTYKKLRRRGSIDFPIVGVCVALRFSENKICTNANIVLGAVASYPVKATVAEAMLVGKKMNTELIEKVAKVAFRPAKPLDNTDMGHSYRKQMARVYVKRSLLEVTGLSN